MAESHSLDAQTANEQIRRCLNRFIGRSYDSFECGSATVFLPDPFTGQLEPAFIAPEDSLPSYRVIESRQDLPDSKLARIAYKTKSVQYSLEPAEDDRCKPDEGGEFTGFDPSHSIMAGPLDSFMWEDGPLGAVLVESTKRVLTDPREAKDDFLRDARVLSTLLWVRKQVHTDAFLKKYQRLALQVLQKPRPIQTLKGTAEDFIEYYRTDLAISEILLEIRHSDSREPLFVPVNPTQFQEEAFQAYLSCVDADHPRVLNRVSRNEHNELLAKLDRAFSEVSRAWAGVKIERDQTTISCLVSRDVRSLADHWTAHDINLLMYGCQLLHELEKRGRDFDSLRHLLRGGREPPGEAGAQFNLLCHVLKEFFDIDQVLMTRVERRPTHHAVVGVRARGFGENDNWIKEDTVRRLPSELTDSSGKPDVLVYILQQYLDKEPLPKILPARVGDTSAEFSLKREVVQRCQLLGKIFYLPCCTTATTGNEQLKSILHLGHSRGTLEISNEVLPLLQHLGAQVADGMAHQERKDMEAKLQAVHSCDSPRQADLEQITKDVADATRSLGCTLFLNSQLLHLIEWPAVKIGELKEALVQLLLAGRDGHWAEIPARRPCERLKRMLADFLGLESCQIDTVISTPNLDHIASVLSEHLYVRAAQSNKPARADALINIVSASLDEPRDAARHLGRFLLEECYIPGFGLTGWVIRYRCSMLLKDKTDDSLRQFFDQFLASIRPPRLAPIIETLQGIDLPSRLKEMPVIRPKHADHISEDPQRRQSQDTYLGFPLEEIGDPVTAAGMLRVSNSASLRQSFEKEDEDTVKDAAIHVSHLLRREYMRRDRYVYDRIVKKSAEFAFQHEVSHLRDDIADLSRTVAEYVPDGERAETEKILGKLDKACAKAERNQELKDLRESIVQVNEANGSKGKLHLYIERWLTLSGLAAEFADPPAPDETRTNGVVMLAFCYLVEEIVQNIQVHRKKTDVCVRLCGGPAVAVLIAECNLSGFAALGAEEQNWLPYRNLAKGTPRGGMKLIDLVAALLNISVQYREESDGKYLYFARLNVG